MATLDTILNIQVQGTSKMTELKNAIDNTSEQLKQFKKEGQQTGESLKQYNAKVVTAETKLKALRGELNKSKSDLIKNAKAVGDTTKSYDSLVKQNANLSAQLRKLPDPLGKNNAEFKKLAGQIKNNTDQLKQMDSAMGRSQRNVGNYKDAIMGVGTAVASAIVVFKTFQRSIQQFTDFQFQIKQVGVISGATAEDLDMLSESAKELGRTTSFTAGEVASFQVELAKLGFDPTEIENMTASALDLAFVFDTDLASAGEQIGIILKSFNLDASETTRVTDVLATAFSNSALDMEKFATAFPKVGAVASQVGFDLEDVTSLMGVLADKGLDASTMGTSLRNIFLKMADSGSDLSKALGGSVTSVDQLIPALQQLVADGIDVTEMLGLTDKRSFTAFASILTGSENVEILNEKLRDSEGTLGSFADEMRDSLKGSIDATTSSLSGFVIEMVETLEPAIRLVIDGVGLFAGMLTKVVENIQLVIVPLATYGASLLVTATNQKLLNGSLLTSIKRIPIFSGVTKIARTVMIAFNTAIKSNPIGLLVSGLALGITALTTFAGSTKETKEESEELNEVIEEQIVEEDKLTKIRKQASEQQKTEIATLKTLVQEIKQQNRSVKEREDALNRFNKIAGTNISNLQDEKKIIKEVEKAYSGAVDEIKRKIILQSTEDQVRELLIRQMDVKKRMLKLDEKLTEQQSVLANETETLNTINEERVSNNARTTDQLLEDGENLIDSSNRQLSNEKKNNQIHRQINTEFLKENQMRSETTNNQVSANIKHFQQIEQKRRNELKHTNNETEILNTTIEDLSLTQNAQSENALNQVRTVGDAKEEVVKTETKINALNEENAGIMEIINGLYSDQEKLLAGLTINTNSFSGATGSARTELQKLQDQVKAEENVLNDLIVQREREIQQFKNSEEFKTMTVKERAERIATIEKNSSDAIVKATNNVIRAKANLEGVEVSLKNTYEDINVQLGLNTKAQEESIKQDEKQLDLLTDLENAGAKVTRERIQQTLKIAKAQLKLALDTADQYDFMGEEFVNYINGLKSDIEGYQQQLNQLSDDGGTGGFLQKTLFGSKEDGTSFTGEDLVNTIGATLDSVLGVMDQFNALQNERLNSSLATLKEQEEEEIELLENSAEFQLMTEEQKTQAIEDIEEKFGDDMLALKIEQWEKDKEFARTQAIIGGAMAIMNILSGTATKNVIADAIIKGIMIAGVIGTTALQLQTINAQKPPTAELGGVMDDDFFAQGGMVQGKSHAQGGEKFSVGGRVVELEGGESVINKRSTSMFKPVLSRINEMGGGRKFADGGMVFDVDSMGVESLMTEQILDGINNQEVILVEADVTQTQKTVKNIETRITF